MMIKISATIFAVGLFLTGCNTDQTETAKIDLNSNEAAFSQTASNLDDQWARDEFDLQRVGPLLERSKNVEEFEYFLNSDDGINNLDLNGDGYADYISVSEFDDRSDNQRGLSLFSRFGPDVVQEIASIVFNRDRPNAQGARILLTGNEQIYGDNAYYETNWLDRSLGIVSTLFSPRDNYYQSPYYYENYPADYQTYQVVETPVYRTRIEQLFPDPVFIQTANPTITEVRIVSPYRGKWMDKVFSKLAKPTKEQIEFRKNNPNRPQFVKFDNDGRKGHAPKGDHDKDERKHDKDRDKDKHFDDDKFDKEKVKAPKPNKEVKDKDKGKGKDKGHDNGKGKGKGKGKGDN